MGTILKVNTKYNILKIIYSDENKNWENFIKLYPKNIREIVLEEVEKFRCCYSRFLTATSPRSSAVILSQSTILYFIIPFSRKNTNLLVCNFITFHAGIFISSPSAFFQFSCP